MINGFKSQFKISNSKPGIELDGAASGIRFALLLRVIESGRRAAGVHFLLQSQHHPTNASGRKQLKYQLTIMPRCKMGVIMSTNINNSNIYCLVG